MHYCVVKDSHYNSGNGTQVTAAKIFKYAQCVLLSNYWFCGSTKTLSWFTLFMAMWVWSWCTDFAKFVTFEKVFYCICLITDTCTYTCKLVSTILKQMAHTNAHVHTTIHIGACRAGGYLCKTWLRRIWCAIAEAYCHHTVRYTYVCTCVSTLMLVWGHAACLCVQSLWYEYAMLRNNPGMPGPAGAYYHTPCTCNT